jgi:hypothetical protein
MHANANANARERNQTQAQRPRNPAPQPYPLLAAPLAEFARTLSTVSTAERVSTLRIAPPRRNRPRAPSPARTT